jgi:hypothetical protein
MQRINGILQQRFTGNLLRLAIAFTLCFLALPLRRASAQQGDEQAGVDQGNYNIRQSIEFGYRFADNSGSKETYNTFINLQQGPRLLDFSTEMRSINHQGSLFDRFYFSNFGYGGDPNNVSRLRISKNKWYNFDAQFRRDENAWNYSLLANPLNPTSPAFANAPAGFNPVIGFSPHLFSTRRRLGDYSLLLMPESRIRFRMGYSRNIVEGPSLTTIHQGTEELLFQQYKTTVNTYRAGIDFRVLPKTNISYDQIWNNYKGDTGSLDQNQNFSIANGTPVDIGVSLNAGANQPCGATFQVTGFINPACSAYFDYQRHSRTRTSNPTEQLSMQSNYFKKVDLSGRVSYTSGSMNVFNWFENWDGRESRTNARNQNTSGKAFGERVAATADFGATWHITDRLEFIDSFHYANFHNPAEFDASSCTFFSPNLLTPANLFTTGAGVDFPVTCPAPADGVAGTPAHAGGSGPDASFAISSKFLKQDEKANLSELEYQFSQKLGVRGGFRYRHRSINDKNFESIAELYFPNNANRGDCALDAGALPDGCVANGDGSFTFTTPTPIEIDAGETFVNEYSGVFGIWARPINNWRISFDTELMSADNSFTRISPRQTQEYRLRTRYKPVEWFNLSGSITIWEGRHNIPHIDNLTHNRIYGFSASFQPRESFNLELGYDYNDVFSQVLICYTSSSAPPGLNNCPGSTLVEQLSTYNNTSHYGYFDASWKPFHRLTTRLGANLTGTSGSVIIISPTAPSGPLNSKYLQPFGGIEYLFGRGWTGKAFWGYHGYHEDSSAVPQDIFAPRNFRANLVTLSLRYAF